MNMKHTIYLNEKEIEQLINGIPVQITNNHGEVTIMQKDAKDLTLSAVNYDKKVVSKSDIRNMKLASSIMSDAPISRF